MEGNPWFIPFVASLVFSFVVLILWGTNSYMKKHGEHRPNVGNAAGLAIKDMFSLGGAIKLLLVAFAICMLCVCAGPDSFSTVAKSIVRRNLFWQPPNRIQAACMSAALILAAGAAFFGFISWMTKPSASPAGNHSTHQG